MSQPILINEETMESIFHRYFGKLVFYANELLNYDQERARDAVTAMFLALWEQKDRLEFNNERALQGYLYTITRNKAIDSIKQAQKEQSVIRDFGYLENIMGEEDSALILTEAIDFIYEAIKTLSPQYRSVIELALQGKSHEEIAEILNIEQVSVRSNKMRAIAVLQKKLKGNALLSIVLMAHLFPLHFSTQIP
jgi:RNA polymerase sigma factor (sigma-70 family)